MPQAKDKDWLNGYKKKKYPCICCLSFQKKARVAILISNKIDFKIKAVKRDKKDTT